MIDPLLSLTHSAGASQTDWGSEVVVVSDLDAFLRSLADVLASEAEVCFEDAEFVMTDMTIERLAEPFKKSLQSRLP